MGYGGSADQPVVKTITSTHSPYTVSPWDDLRIEVVIKFDVYGVFVERRGVRST